MKKVYIVLDNDHPIVALESEEDADEYIRMMMENNNLDSLPWAVAVPIIKSDMPKMRGIAI